MTTAKERTLKAMGKKPARTRSILRFTLDGRAFDCDIRSITIRENREAQLEVERLGLPLLDTHITNARAAWICARRSLPEITLDEVLDAMTLGDLMDYNDGVHDQVEEDPDSPQP